MDSAPPGKAVGMSAEPTPIEYVVAALAQAHYSGMTLEEVMLTACKSQNTKHFDRLVNDFCDYTNPATLNDGKK